MPRKTEGGLARLTNLAREATTGAVSDSAHVAGRARFLEAVEEENSRAFSLAPMRVAFALAAVVALVVGGWGIQRWRAPEWTVEGAVASDTTGSAGSSETSDTSQGFVRAPAGSSATIAFADGSAVVLAPSARARVVRGDRRHVVLEEGRAEIRITHSRMLAWSFDAGPFTVRAAQGGLAMAWSGDGEQLDVWPHDAETTVQGGLANTGITIHGGDHLTARARDGELRVVRADGSVTTDLNSAPPSATDADASAAATDPSVAPTATPPPPSTSSPIPRQPWSALVSRGDYDTVLRDATSAGLDSVLAHRPLADLSALADASRYRGQTALSQRALTTERARFPSSKEAHTAAFLLGRLADDQSHDPARAATWYDRYLAEAPSGPFASDALGRKMIAVQTSQGPAAAKPIAEQYARRYPHGAYAAQAEEIRTR